ncbi:hypothetical protein DPMN_127092 [Dreissena polymorpha]|uniref:Uncharacterized protein n=1 Tax=Dreissena polymorpha TaxID=45954 RepID=A0A9D4GYB9_DREPO|nr:hypothetical protein DPMN_127092 [Dreissena polymorpha]
MAILIRTSARLYHPWSILQPSTSGQFFKLLAIHGDECAGVGLAVQHYRRLPRAKIISYALALS